MPFAASATAPVLDIPGGAADAVIARLAAQSDVQLLFKPATVADCRTAPISGRMSPLTALRRMLAPCALQIRQVAGGAIVIEPRARSVAHPFVARAIQPSTPEDIVVTALKRETRLDMTAISMDALRGIDLARLGQSDLRSVAAADANLTALDTGTGEQRLILRGIYGNGEATVGVYYDETPVTGPVGTSLDPGIGAADLDLIDVDRIEILRGPQGTLYGSGSMGGTVRILFNKPDLAHASGQVSAGLAAAEGGQVGETLSGVLNLPIVTDRLAVRAVAYRRVSPGYVDDRVAGANQGGRIVRDGGRLALDWRASDAVSIAVTGAIQDLSAPNNGGWYPADGRYANDQPVATPYRSRMRMANVTGHADLGWATLTATGSYYSWRQLRVYDYTSVLSGLRGSAAGCGRLFGTTTCSAAQQAAYGSYVDGRLPGLLYQPMRTNSASGEIRIASTEGGRFDWTAGLFAEHRHDTVDSYALRADAATGQVIDPFDITGYRQVFYTLGQKAAFGETTWHALRTIDLTFGGRYFDYVGSGRGTLIVPNIITGTNDNGVTPLHTREHGSSLKAELSWHPSAGLLAYVQAAQGFRPGGINITPGLSDAQRTYRSDHLWSYEAGLKYHPPGAWGSADLGVYHVDWSDMIYKIRSENGAFAYNANIAPVTINGAELQSRATPWKGGVVALGLSFVDARVSRDQAEPSADGLVRRGDRIPEVPRWNATVALHQSIDAGKGRVLRGGVTTAFTSAYASQFNPAMSYYQRTGSRFIANFDATLSARVWSVSLLIDNLLDSDRPSTILSDPYGNRRFYNGGPRTYRFSLTRTF